MNKKTLLSSAALACCLGFAAAGGALAQDGAAPAPAQWLDTLKFSLQIDAGASVTPGDSTDSKNFGHLFDDNSNAILLNQILATVQRPIDPTVAGYDFGFKLQGLYGSDARYTRPVHEFNSVLRNDLNQFNIVEANVQAHTPWLTEGGVDFKVGRFATPIGYETIDPSTNPFYSHSFIFNFGLPLEHTGAIATWHATPMFDLYAGGTTGVNSGLDHGLLHAQNGAAPAFLGGVGVNLMDGKLTILGLTHVGPEYSNYLASNNAKDEYRYFNDIVTTWKVTDAFTLVNELNWVRDDVGPAGKGADAFGMAQYGMYALTDEVSLVGRAEVYRDAENFFVFQSGNNWDTVRMEEGLPALSPNTHNNLNGGPTTYGELTIGINYKPTLGVEYPSSLLIRPEVRYDASLNDTKPFNGNRHDDDNFTAAVDAVLTF